MAKVRKVMSTNVPRVKSSNTILEAANVMNRERTSGAAVVEGEKVVGLITERALLWKFVPLNKRPDEVTVGEMLVPFFRTGPDESTKNAAKMMVANGITRLGVFDDEKLLGWVTLTDLTREVSRPHLLRALTARDEPEQKQILCPNCRKALLEKITNMQGVILKWECPNCPLLSLTFHGSPNGLKIQYSILRYSYPFYKKHMTNNPTSR